MIPVRPTMLALALVLMFAPVVFADARKPNVLLLFIDDLGWTDVGVNGSEFHETPHIDALAKTGVNFTRSYAANPVCSPTRAAMMTGKAPQRVGITQWISSAKVSLPLSEITIAEAFQEAGYRTGYIGKWHLGKKDPVQPQHQGFEFVSAVNRAGSPASYFYPFQKGKAGHNVPDLQSYKEGDYLTDALTDKAIEFVTSENDKPFFLCLSHYAVHTPIQSPKPLIKKYQAKKVEMYGDGERKYIDGKYGTHVSARQEHPAYAAMVENLDANIGRLMEELKEQGLLDNTIVVLTSDNGGLSNLKKRGAPTSNAPLRSGKGWTYEGGIRIPTIIRWLGHINPATHDTPIITMDMYPTLLDLCSIPLKPKQHLDGKSLKGLLAAETDSDIDDRFLAWTYPHHHGSGHRPSDAILSGPWKLIRWHSDEPTELYNLADDVGERNNLADQHPEKVKELTARLDNWLAETKP